MPTSPYRPADAANLRFVVAVVYEDDQTRDRAVHLCDQMAEELEAEVQFDFTWWKFHFLRDPILAGQAANAVSTADMVIISTHPGDDLPEHLKSWVESWIPRRKFGAAALVGFVGPADSAHHGVCPRHNYLRNVAARAGMDYLPEGVFTPTTPGETRENLVQRAETLSPMLRDILAARQTIRQWGLNE